MMETSRSSGTSTPVPLALSQVNGHGKPYERPCFLSDAAKVSSIDGIRGLLKHEVPGVVSFVCITVAMQSRAGKPNPSTFPFQSIQLNLKPSLSSTSPDTEAPLHLTIEGQDLDHALQYGPSSGLVTLRKWLSDLQTHVHGRQQGDWTVCLGSGSQDLMTKGFAAVLNPGDPVLLETPLYAGVLPALRALNADMIEVDVDDQGLSAESLESILSAWPADKKRPKVVYSTPTGCNPSGCSASKERKLAVLQVCKKYGLLMFEDDPYFYLAEDLIPSYFELETQVFPEGGHVLRFDSFSKLLSAGLRLGYATGPKDLLSAIEVGNATYNLHTSSISQAVAYRLLQHWGISGFLDHSHAVAAFYAERRKVFEAIAHKHLDGLATWVSPVAGMFLWIDLAPSGITDTYNLVLTEALAKGVLAVPGFSFYPLGRVSSHVRVSFSLVDLEVDADLGFKRLAEAIREKQKTLSGK
ncbi:tryptophan aminotransferase, partial [Tremellales sp. Uapishka_1]